MKPLLFCTAALALAASVGAVALQAVPNEAPRSATRIDEPPPEPIDCPFCGGDGMLHVRRMRVIERQAIIAALVVLPR
jgi:hypothetical protein